MKPKIPTFIGNPWHDRVLDIDDQRNYIRGKRGWTSISIARWSFVYSPTLLFSLAPSKQSAYETMSLV
jgi:hypothetical protein